ncbi:DUF881 domain-containing protein [Psychrobacillus vulpis]|uniref:DUF881 domain-containing protein n=1 Tax=Psychrobacillus vulpis TaxID=2325572 RepID=A0A544TGD2_9BACI|nr:DUF881 domain-containing protein [Psychrobacillus vulpis]TQR16476.1 DUF881 domain-containing protein [Psychrobacillus vulpis]
MKKNKLLRIPSRGLILISLVSLVLGFILAYSYSISSAKRDQISTNTVYFNEQEKYKEDLIEQKERNKELTEEINAKQQEIRDFEHSFANSEESVEELVKEAEMLRLLIGDIPSQGKGIAVSLQDGAYNPSQENPNEYIVHESHVFKVINELKISGAEAISINGQRLHSNSFIRCTGPVITVDGKTFPAPFVIEAVGDPAVLLASVNLGGGVVDQLASDNIVVTVEEKGKITMPALRDDKN